MQAKDVHVRDASSLGRGVRSGPSCTHDTDAPSDSCVCSWCFINLAHDLSTSGVAALARAHVGGVSSEDLDADLRGAPVLGAELARRLAAASADDVTTTHSAPQADRAEFAAGLRPEDGSHRSVEEARDLIRGLMASRADAAGDDR